MRAKAIQHEGVTGNLRGFSLRLIMDPPQIDFQDLADALGMTKTEARDRYARIRKDVLDISCPAQKADAKEETEEAEAETDVERSSEEDARMAVFRGH